MRMRFSRTLPLGSVSLLAASLCGCGSGTAALVAGNSDPDEEVPATITAFNVLNPRGPVATVRFTLSRPAEVKLRYRTGSERDLETIQLPQLLEGGSWTFEWAFAAERDLGGGYQPGVLVYGAIPGLQEDPIEGENAATVALGNDEPTIEVSAPPVEVDGVVPIVFTVADSSGDAVSVRVEFDDGSGWRPARPGGLAEEEATPEFGVEGRVAPPEGVQDRFFWDSDYDLPQLERQVRIRMTPVDDLLLEGLSDETGPFLVDNNSAPIAQLDSGAIVINPDERRGIPIPVRVIDEESDSVELLVQWRRRGENFPDLPSDPLQLDAALEDPLERRRLHLCTPYPRYASGRVRTVDADRVRLPELGAEEAWIVHAGLVGQTLELLRPSKEPEPVEASWSAAPLVAPVGIVPLDDGLRALTLEGSTPARLREIELASGRELHVLATFGNASPSTLALERGTRDSALVALEEGGLWRVERVSIEDGSRELLYQSNGSLPGPVHGLASLSRGAAVLSVADSLVQLDYREPSAARAAVLLDGLAEPRGLVLDPLRAGHVYLAERSATTSAGTGRVLSIDLARRSIEEVTIRSTPQAPLERPEALALQRNGARLLVVTRNGLDEHRLIGVDLGGAAGNAAFAFGGPISAPVRALATGPDDLVLLVTSGAAGLLVGGGIEQRRTVAAYDLPAAPGARSRQVVTVDVPLEPRAREGQPWRIPLRARRIAPPEGLATNFVWDSADAFGDLSGEDSARPEVYLRVTPRDDELGTAGVGAAPKLLRTALDVEPVHLGGSSVTPVPQDVVATDFDGDGRVDIACTSNAGDSVAVFLQDGEGSFDLAGLPLGVGDGPTALVAADLDQNGRPDLAVTNRTSGNLTVLYGPAAGGSSETLGGPGTTDGASDVTALDFDCDGDLDLACAGETASNVALFRRGATGFSAIPGIAGIRPVALAQGDLDGDGALDLVVAQRSPGKLVLYRNSQASFAEETILTLPSFSPSAVTLFDVDLDGDLDVATAQDSPTGEIVTFVQGVSPWTFDEVAFLGGSSLGTQTSRAILAADLEADGLVDLVVAAKNAGGGGRLAAFMQRSRARFEPFPSLMLLASPGSNVFPYGLSCEDLDGDGDLDLVSANEGSNDLSILHSAWSARRPSLGEILVPGDAFIPPILPVDLSNDGDLDLVIGKGGGNFNHMELFLQETPGLFGNPIELVLTLRPSVLTGGDIDGDGRVDIALTDGVSQRLAVLRQAPSGSLQLAQEWVQGSPRCVTAADLDGDGFTDLACARFGSDDVAVFFQDEIGFPKSPPLLLGNSTITDGPAWIISADLDADGRYDLVVANQLGDSLALFYQESIPREFAARNVGDSSITNGAFSVIARDLDADGDLDLACANNAGHDMAVFMQVAPRSFVPLANLNGGSRSRRPESIAAGDLDGDGDIDLALVCLDSDSVCLFFQDSPGSFRSTPFVLPVTDPKFVSIADLDGDGDEDMAVSASNGTVSLFWGGR